MKAFVAPVMAKVERPDLSLAKPKNENEEMSSSSDESRVDKKVGLWKRLTKTV